MDDDSFCTPRFPVGRAQEKKVASLQGPVRVPTWGEHGVRAETTSYGRDFGT